MSKNFTNIENILASSSFWQLNKNIVKYCGLVEAMMLTCIAEAIKIYRKNPNFDGWVYQTIETIEKEVGIGRKAQDRALITLERLGLIDKQVRGQPPKRYFSLNHHKILEIIDILDNHDDYSGTNAFVQKGQIKVSKRDKLKCPKGTTNKEININITNSKEFVANQASSDADCASNSVVSELKSTAKATKQKKNIPDLEAIAKLLTNYKIQESLDELDLTKNQILYLHWLTLEVASSINREGILYNLSVELPYINQQLNGESIKRQQLKKYILWLIGDGKQGIIARKGTLTHFRSTLRECFEHDWAKLEKELLKKQQQGYSAAHQSKPTSPSVPPKPKEPTIADLRALEKVHRSGGNPEEADKCLAKIRELTKEKRI